MLSKMIVNRNLKYKYFFFDFFGTVMLRKCSGDDIKRIWSKRISAHLGYRVSEIEIYNLRIEIEQILSRSKKREFRYEEMLDKMSETLKGQNLIVGEQLQAFVSFAKEAECDIEEHFQVVNDSVINIAREVKRKGKRVYILSDFYMGKESICRFLENKNISGLFDDIFVSCDYMCNKATGTLYRVILTQQQLKETECFMIGDNFRSDFVNAKRSGISAHWIVRAGDGKKLNSMKEFDRIICNSTRNALNYANYSFCFYNFIKSLYEDLVRQQAKTIYFFSREGELLKYIFDVYSTFYSAKCGHEKIVSKYLYVSRQSTYAASLGNIESENFYGLFHVYNEISIAAFLRSIGFEDSNIQLLENNLNEDFNVMIDDFPHSKEFDRLKKNSLFVEIYGQTVKNSKDSLLGYLNQEGFCDNAKTFVVDVGWRGSIQSNIVNALGNKVDVVGYYCGLSEPINFTKKGVLFNGKSKTQGYKIWSYDASFMERILTASHPSTRGYVKKGNMMVPIFNSFDSEKTNYEIIKPIQDLMKKQFSILVEVDWYLPENRIELNNILERVHIFTCCHVGKDNMKLQASLLKGQMENFGIQTTAGNNIKRLFTLKSIIKKIEHNIKFLFNAQLIVLALNAKGYFRMSAFVFRIQGLLLLKYLSK